MVALSFVRSPDDIKRVHADHGRGRACACPVIAKIEKPEAVDNLEEIVDAFDGIMVARGDLGVEMPLEQVPLVQKRAVQLRREYAKPVIVATQMLESMIENSRPTRAEASDVANAVLDGADARHAVRRDQRRPYPVETVAHDGADHLDDRGGRLARCRRLQHEPAHAAAARIARAAADGRPQPSAPRRWSRSRRPATPSRLLAVHRSPMPLLAFTPGAGGAQPARAVLGRGDVPRAVGRSTPTTWSARSTRRCSASAAASRATYVVIVAGSPPGTPGSTNTLRVHQLGTPVPSHPDYGRRHDDPPLPPAPASTPDEQGPGLTRARPRPQRGT